jgi:hypothetical protein
MLVQATALTMTFEFINANHLLIDRYTLPAPPTDEHCTTTYVQESADDGEQVEITGTVDLDGQDLDITTDIEKERNQVIGVRFQGVSIPPGATILAAMLEFRTTKARDLPASFVIHGVAADHAPAFGTQPFALSTLPQTGAALHWENVPPWLIRNYPEPSPDVSAILQEIIDRPGWQSGNAISFIITGSGTRAAHAYEGDPGRMVGLTFKYSMEQAAGGGNRQLLPIIRR